MKLIAQKRLESVEELLQLDIIEPLVDLQALIHQYLADEWGF
jgi:hypothetical protein